MKPGDSIRFNESSRLAGRTGRVVRLDPGNPPVRGVLVRLDFSKTGKAVIVSVGEMDVIPAVDQLAATSLPFKQGDRVVLGSIDKHGTVVEAHMDGTVDITWDGDETDGTRGEEGLIPSAHRIISKILHHECAIRRLAELDDEHA